MEQWQNTASQMTDGQVENILASIGLEVQSETETNYIVFCPFHINTHTAALSVSKDNGVFYCFGAGCGESGNLIKLIRQVKGGSYFSSLRLIEKHKGESVSLEDKIKKIQDDQVLPAFPAETLKKMQDSFLSEPKPKKYMNSRGITNQTSQHFGIGYDPKRDMICVPMYDKDFRPVGIVGRTIEYKSFKNSVDLPTSKTLFNYNNARTLNNNNVIIVESSFDAMRVYQATGKAVVATLGGSFTDIHCSQIYRSFNGVILGVDNDEAGRKFAKRIAKKCKSFGLIVRQARYSETELFPSGAKDFGDCSDNQIKHMIDNACVYTP